ncbi:STAG domain-containing protein [Cladochytrium replicatum]|nr:STAG domain-containing protein [Cladochytrium replicatum]
MMIGLTGDGETEPPPLRRSTRSKKNLEQSSPASQASTTTPVSASSKGGRGRPRIVPSSSPKGQKEKKNLQQAPEAEEDDRNLSSESSDGDSGSDTYEDAQGYNTTRSSITHAAGRGRGGRGGRSTSTRSRDADMSSATKEAHGRSIKSRKPSGASRGRKRVSAELDDGLNGSDDVSDASESVPSRKGNTSGRNHSKRTRISGNYIPVLVFEAVTAKNAALQTLVGEWQESYELYPAEAFEEMINFLLESCGCPEPVNKDALDDPDLIGDALQVLQNQFEEASLGQYPILSKTKKPNAPVRRSLQDFWSRWVANLRGNLLFEEDEEAGSVLDDLKTWLITMSSSPFKPFRHTSTFITLVIMTALCEMLKTVTLEWSTINRQVEAQIRKGSSAASGRQKELKDKADNLSSNKAKVESHIQDLFNSLFMHRYRDSDPNIRAECIRELGVWTSLAPEIFLDPQYLRYLGWMLFDNVGSVRMESVKALLTLYSSKTEGFVSGLRPFTERFKSRLLDMAAREVDPAVRTTAAKVVIQVAMSNLLYDNERDKVLLLLFDADPQSRELVAEFAISVWKEDYLQPRCQDLGRLAFIGGNGNESMDLGDNLDIQTVDPKLQLKALCVMLTHLMKELAERNRKKFSVSNSTVEALTEAAKSIHRGPSYAQNPSRSVGSLGSQGSLAYSQSLGQNGSQVTDENFILLADVEAIDDDSDGEDISMEDKSGVEETEIGHKSVSKEKESIPDEWGGAELLPERGDGDVEELSEWVSRLGEENISQISGSERAEVQFVPILGVSDVLWDRLDVVKNWQQMFEYLIDDFHEPNYSQESQESQSLDLESTRRATLRPTRGEEICLLYLLSSALSRTLKAPEHFDLTVALGGENEKISVGKKKQKKAAEKGSAVDIADVKLEVSRHIIRYIPKLLQKYSAEQVLGGEYTKEVYNYSCERLREALRFISLIDIGI